MRVSGMFRQVASLEDLWFSELQDWFKHQRGKTPVRVRGQLWGFIMYQPHIKSIVYVTPRRPEHFYVKYQGFGVSESIFQRLQDSKVNYIFIRYKGKRLLWHLAEIETYLNGIPEHDPRDPSDLQRIVPIKKTFTKSAK